MLCGEWEVDSEEPGEVEGWSGRGRFLGVVRSRWRLSGFDQTRR